MSVEDDKAFDDQIEKMKLKNQHILEKFHASEEDRKRAENHGATIKRDQNISIRLKPEDIPKLRNNRSNMPRPKSFHDKIHQEEQFQSSYNQFNDNRKSIKFKKSQLNEERAYLDYMHFQQVYSVNRNSNNFNNSNRPIHRQNSHPNYTEEVNIQKLAHQDFNKFNNQNMRNRSSQKFAQINHSSKTFKENDFYNPNYAKTSKDNEFQGQNFHNLKFQRENDHFHNYNSKFTKDNDFHSNHQKFSKENDYNNYKVNHNKEQFQKPYNGNSNPNSKRRAKSKTNPNYSNNNNNKPVVNGSGDANANTKKKSTLDDEYIDDTLEDLEQYRLKVDMEDFIVIDPESPDPILAMPLKPWTNNDVLNDLEANKSDGECKLNELSAHLLNNANMRAKDYFNLVDQNAIEHISCAESNDQSQFDKNTVDISTSVNSINNEFSTKTNLSDEESVQNQISEKQTNCKSDEIQESGTQINVENEVQVNEISKSNNVEDQQLDEDLFNSEKDIINSETKSHEITVNNTANSEHDPTGSIND